MAGTETARARVKGVPVVVGAGRSAADVAAELMEVLADEPRVVECDLAGVVGPASTVVDELAPVSHYLARWPVTLVVGFAPEPALHAGLRAASLTDQFIVHCSGPTPEVDEHRLLPPIQHRVVRLAPEATLPRDARAFVTRTLLDWQVPQLIAPATEVASELVAGAVTASTTTVEVSAGRIDGRVRVAVREHETASPPTSLGDVPQSPLTGAGLQLVQALVRDWGVIPARSGGQTVWAVLEDTTQHHDRTGHAAAVPATRRPLRGAATTRLGLTRSDGRVGRRRRQLARCARMLSRMPGGAHHRAAPPAS